MPNPPIPDLAFEPDIMLPAQVNRPAIPDMPETRLWGAILQDAVDVYTGLKPANPSTVNEAAEWIAEESNAITSFAWVCSLVGIDADSCRERLRRRRVRGIKGLPSVNGARGRPPRYPLATMRVGDQIFLRGEPVQTQVNVCQAIWRMAQRYGYGEFETRQLRYGVLVRRVK